MRSLIEPWRERARRLKREVRVVSLAARHPRLPWHVRLLAVAIVGYAFSPIDLIPDFVPVLGYLDDLILLPLAIILLLRLIPGDILAECRARAAADAPGKPKSWIAAALIVALWIALALLGLRLLWPLVGG